MIVTSKIKTVVGSPTRKASAPSKGVCKKPKPHLYLFVFGSWALSMCWFHPRLLQLLDLAYHTPSWWVLAFFIFFIELAWLYGFYNLGIVLFAIYYRRMDISNSPIPIIEEVPEVAILYTTCNDFITSSAVSCVKQNYPRYTVYILDDSSDPNYQKQVNDFAGIYPERVVVVRRNDRKGFKAGNLNNALAKVAIKEPYFAIADADEILPTDFLSKLVPILHTDETCGFIQANHKSNPAQKSPLAQALGIGIDIHWRWHQPLRNLFGFVMFLGHGALIKRKCWEEVNGFPEIVSEDLAFAIRVREKGYRGRFESSVMCYEDFPDTIRAFRIRHMKWTRGTCEFLSKEGIRLIKSREISWTEKFDILFPTLNLPLTFFYFLFMIDANVLLPYFFGQPQTATWVIGDKEWLLPSMTFAQDFGSVFTPDFFVITLMTFFAPVFCFILALIHRPLRLFKFLCHSTAVYAALSPLSTIGTLSFMITRKATFLVTGDVRQNKILDSSRAMFWFGGSVRNIFSDLLKSSHPDQWVVQAFELLTGVIFALVCLYLVQISFFGLCLAFILLPIMHHVKWENPVLRRLVYLPFIIILLGLLFSSLAVMGMQSVFFGYGFHF